MSELTRTPLEFSWTQHGRKVKVISTWMDTDQPLQVAAGLRRLSDLIENTWVQQEKNYAAKLESHRTFRFLAEGEKLEEGDEFWYGDEKKWLPVTIGGRGKAHPDDLIRREVTIKRNH